MPRGPPVAAVKPIYEHGRQFVCRGARRFAIRHLNEGRHASPANHAIRRFSATHHPLCPSVLYKRPKSQKPDTVLTACIQDVNTVTVTVTSSCPSLSFPSALSALAIHFSCS